MMADGQADRRTGGVSGASIDRAIPRPLAGDAPTHPKGHARVASRSPGVDRWNREVERGRHHPPFSIHRAIHVRRERAPQAQPDPGHDRALADGYDATLSYLDRMHAEAVELFGQLTPADLERKCTTPAGIPITPGSGCAPWRSMRPITGASSTSCWGSWAQKPRRFTDSRRRRFGRALTRPESPRLSPPVRPSDCFSPSVRARAQGGRAGLRSLAA